MADTLDPPLIVAPSDRAPLSQTLLQGSEFVYFIGCGRGGAIKVGRARDTHKRLLQLQVGNAAKLTLLYEHATSESEKVEAHLHSLFAKHWIRGEWFRRNKVLTDTIDRMQRGQFALPELPMLNGRMLREYAAKVTREDRGHLDAVLQSIPVR